MCKSEIHQTEILCVLPQIKKRHRNSLTEWKEQSECYDIHTQK